MGFKKREESVSRKLKKAIKSFEKFARDNRWHKYQGALDECMNASDCFLYELEKVGLDGIIEYYDFEAGSCTRLQSELDVMEYPYHVDVERFRCHWAVRVNKTIIDWTARQFDEKAPFPAIWTSERRRWRNCE